ncbi:MAG: hypothetical protein R6W76_00845 [Caldilinea sp.]
MQPSGGLSASIDPNAKESHALFRRQVELDRVPTRVPARITADSRYALFVNGQEVCRGPVRSQPRRMHYDLRDLRVTSPARCSQWWVAQKRCAAHRGRTPP